MDSATEAEKAAAKKKICIAIVNGKKYYQSTNNRRLKTMEQAIYYQVGVDRAEGKNGN